MLSLTKSNKMKHTKGNWNIQEDGVTIIVETDRGMKNVKITQKTYSDRINNEQANAKLIAAAPELLEALRIAQTYLKKNSTLR